MRAVEKCKCFHWLSGEFRPSFLGAFAKLRKGPISFVISVCPSVRMGQLGSHWMYFHENSYLSISRKSVEKTHVSLKSEKKNGYFTWRRMYIYDNISMNLLRKIDVSEKIVEKIKTHILCLIFFLRKSCPLWDNVEKYGRARQATDDNITRRLRFACWVTGYRHSQNMYHLLLFHDKHIFVKAPQCYVICTLPSWYIYLWPCHAVFCVTYAVRQNPHLSIVRGCYGYPACSPCYMCQGKRKIWEPSVWYNIASVWQQFERAY
jgi:hypothetical protein